MTSDPGRPGRPSSPSDPDGSSFVSDTGRPPSPSEFTRLLDVLHRAGGQGVTATEIAELIWLARHGGASAPASGPGAQEPTPETEPAPSGAAAEPAAAPEPSRASADGPGTQLSPRSDEEPSGEGGDEARYRSFLAPLPPMLAYPLALQRALRPLRRQVPSRLNRELDERSTAYRIARQGALPGTWLPVLRAKPERWLTLYLVYDAGPTMPMWRPLWRELHHVLGQTGAFRGVRLLALTEDGRLRQSPGGRPAALPPRDGRAAALVLSDCSGPHWYAGHEATARWYGVLGRWARTMPVAVVQPLPERLWRRTALPGTAGLLAARGPAAANSALRFTPYEPTGEEHSGLPLPLLEPSARWFAHWAELVAGSTGTEVPGVAALLPAGLSATPLERGGVQAASLSPEELVLDFRAHASPQALRLATHLAAGEPTLPVMRLVHAVTEARPEPQHLAEVVLSGLLTTAPGSPASSGHYAFRPGVREVLSRAVPRSTAARIGAAIQRYAGAGPGEFPVVARDEDGDGTKGRPEGEPVAVVTDETVRRLGGSPDRALGEDGRDTGTGGPGFLIDGRYRLVERRHAGPTSDLWRTMDEARDREATLKLFHAPVEDGTGRQAFLVDAELLAATDIGGLARVTGFGFHEGRPYAVTDPIEGEPFEDLLDPVARPLTWESVRAIGGQLIEILDALHRNGLPHLDLDAATLVRRHDGRVVVVDPGLGVHGLPGDRGDAYRRWTAPPPAYRSPEQLFGRQVDHRSDLYALGCLFYAMVTGAAPALTHRAVRNAWAHGGPHPGPEFHSVHPPGFDALVTDLLAARPEDRPADAQTVKARLMSVPADDPELTAVAGTVLALDPDGTRMGRVLRNTIDSVLDGERTGRYDWTDLFKTERTHLGTLVEIAVQREFGFDNGDAMDYRIAGVEVDCKYSQRFGGWMIPPEAEGHLCLLVWADDHKSRWSVGLVRAARERLSVGSNRDRKATVRAERRDEIVWLWRDADLPENVLLHIPAEDRAAILAHASGQRRLDELFRRVQRRRIGRNTVRTVAQQKDYMKRVRGNGGSRSRLRPHGIVVLGDYRSHQEIARGLGLPIPREGEFVSVRLVRAVPGDDRPFVELDGARWSVASPEDPVVTAPELPSSLGRVGDEGT
ncbi:NaeI family type II restriction endonuclease [Streptomyces bacillaris]|uniref:NaeI family type II restriction endonuclease n=1 Tax=Streptomyces bacillaris TaxID=68179 RepID=UPI00362A8776